MCFKKLECSISAISIYLDTITFEQLINGSKLKMNDLTREIYDNQMFWMGCWHR